MDAINILSADILDIIFENQNKDYGAYQLRKGYQRRMQKALLGTITVCALLLMLYYLGNRHRQSSAKPMFVGEVELTKVPEADKPDPIIPKNKPLEVATVRDVTIRIVKDDQVKKQEVPPVEDLETAKISIVTQAGVMDDVTTPPANDNRGVVEIPKQDEAETIFKKVEIESSFPGGAQAWMRYLVKNIQDPSEASEAGIQGGITVRFIVDQEGNTSAVEAVDGAKELREEAVRVIQRSGKWIPAIQNGKKVKSYKEQRIIFKLAE